jgi:hypothetical protein
MHESQSERRSHAIKAGLSCTAVITDEMNLSGFMCGGNAVRKESTRSCRYVLSTTSGFACLVA